MKKINSCLVLASITAFALIGCNQQPPDVVSTPGSTTVVHDKTPSAPNVTVNTPPSNNTTVIPPSSPSTNSTTVTTPDGTSSSTTTKTTG